MKYIYGKDTCNAILAKMFYYFKLQYLFFILLITFIQNGQADDDDDVCYKVEVGDDVLSCEGYEDGVLNADKLKLAGDGSPCLNGPVYINELVEDGVKVDVVILKVEDTHEEHMYAVQADLCSSFSDDDTPWYPIFSNMKITSCPIEKGEYNVEDMVVNMESVSGFADKSYMGTYNIQVSLVTDQNDKLSCSIIQVGIVESREC